MREEWRDIEGFEGYYMVSNMGRIKERVGINASETLPERRYQRT